MGQVWEADQTSLQREGADVGFGLIKDKGNGCPFKQV